MNISSEFALRKVEEFNALTIASDAIQNFIKEKANCEAALAAAIIAD